MSSSIIVPIHNEEAVLPSFFNELKYILDTHFPDNQIEVIFVNDGSTDNTQSLLTEYCQIDARFKVIRLALNYGQTFALHAGFKYAKGTNIIFIDGDNQNPPIEIVSVIKRLEKGHDYVQCSRLKSRQTETSKVFPSKIANFIIKTIFNSKFNDIGCGLKGVKRELLEKIDWFSHCHRVIPLLLSHYSSNSVQIEISHRKRLGGKSHYGLERIYKIFIDVLRVIYFNRYKNEPFYFAFSIFLLSFIPSITISILIWYSKLDFLFLAFMVSTLNSLIVTSLVNKLLIQEMTIGIQLKSSPEIQYSVLEKINL